MSALFPVPANSPDPVDERLLARLRRVLDFLLYARKYATYELAFMSLGASAGSYAVDSFRGSPVWSTVADCFLIVGLMLLCGALPRTAKKNSKTKRRKPPAPRVAAAPARARTRFITHALSDAVPELNGSPRVGA